MEKTEKEIVEKAIQPLKRFIFINTEKLIHDLTQIYPAATHIAIINNDDRDGAGIPRITFKKLRNATLTITKTKTYSTSGRLLSEELTSVKGTIDHILCVVQDGFVTIKKNYINIGGEP